MIIKNSLYICRQWSQQEPGKMCDEARVALFFQLSDLLITGQYYFDKNVKKNSKSRKRVYYFTWKMKMSSPPWHSVTAFVCVDKDGVRKKMHHQWATAHVTKRKANLGQETWEEGSLRMYQKLCLTFRASHVSLPILLAALCL